MNERSLEECVGELSSVISATDELVRVVLSGRRRNFAPVSERIDMRPVEIKGGLHIQVMSSDGRAMTTKNYLPTEFNFSDFVALGYSNILVETINENISLRISKKGLPLYSRKRAINVADTSHDKSKDRLLNSADPYLIEIGISDHNGKVKPSRADKYKQVEEFLRLLVPAVEDAISSGRISKPTDEKPLTIVDLGCGHAYLTFAAHQYFSSQKIPVHVTGIDVRESSRLRNEDIASRLGISRSITFKTEAISETTVNQADVAIALHACDTATDDAIAWAVNHKVTLALFAPCCHHDIQSQMSTSPEPWNLITRNGIMKERLGDLITDALRMQIMKMNGYRVEAMEFIGGEHTPRNLMIRGALTEAKVDPLEIERYQQMKSQWSLTPVLESKLSH